MYWLAAIADFVSTSVMFGVMSTVLASTALWVAYRNNFGWKPMLLIISYSIGAGGVGAFVGCRFEFWNRRKYPVVLRELHVSWLGAKLSDDDGMSYDEWCVTSKGNMAFEYKNGKVVKPGEAETFEVHGDLPAGAAACVGPKSPVKVWVQYFDPKSQRHIVATASGEDSRNSWINKMKDAFSPKLPHR